MLEKKWDIVYSSEKLAKFFGVRKETIQEWCKKGKLPGFKIGKEWKVRVRDLERLIQGKVKATSSKSDASRLF